MKEFFRLLRRFVPPYKKYLIWALFLNLLSAILNIFSFALIIPILQILFKMDTKTYEFIPWDAAGINMKDIAVNNFYYYVTEMIASQGGSLTLLILGIFLAVMTLLKAFSYFASSAVMIPLRTGVVRDIRAQVYNKVLHLPLSFFSEERKGDIIARMSGDVTEVETSVTSSLDMLIKNPILIIAYFGTLIAISWQLTLFVFILLPFAGYVMGTVGKKLKRKSFEGQQQWGYLMSQIEETLGGLRVIKAFNAEAKIQDRFEKSNETFRRLTNRIYRRQQMAHPMSEFLGTATIAIVLWYGGTLILSSNSPIDASTFIYYLVIFYSIINPAKDLSKASYAIQKGLASMDRVDKILKAESNINDPEDPKPIALTESICYRDVWFKYQHEWVLPRFYDVDKGSITIDGTDVRDATLYDLRSLMGNVNQEAILFNDTFFNNISFGVEGATLEQVQEAARIANAHDFIMASEDGYDTNIGDRGGKLSGGQRQRISIARAILKNPPILILDEATSALDTESDRLVQVALDNLMRNRTTIVIAHRLSTIRNADEICVMHEGEIVERGRHEELIALDGYYKRLCDMQSF